MENGNDYDYQMVLRARTEIIRSQLVPNPGSPLSLETWCMADLESWLCDSTTLLRNTFHAAQQDTKMASYQDTMHVAIPLVTSMGAGSPTLYDSPHNGKMFMVPSAPPSYVQVKQELEEVDYCNSVCSSPPVMQPAVTIKKEEEVLSRDKIEQVRRLAVEQAGKDIHVACGILGISPDPTLWSLDEVKSWLLWTLNLYGLSSEVLRHFDMDGLELLTLPESFFRQKIPLGGDLIYAQLEIWKTAAHLKKQIAPKNVASFRPEESMLDLSCILDQWVPNAPQSSHYQMSPPHRMSPPAGTRGGHQPQQQLAIQQQQQLAIQQQQQLAIQQQQLQQPLTPQSIVPDSSSSVASPDVGQDFGSEDMQSDGSVIHRYIISQRWNINEISDESCEMERCVPQPSSTVNGSVSGSGIGNSSPGTGVASTSNGIGNGSGSGGRHGSHSHIHLWQFLKELLGHSHLYGSCIRWLDRPKGIFKIEDSVRVARLWGKRKNRPAMNYDKLSRSIRQYYKKGIMKKTERSQRLVYQFCHPYGL